MIGLVMLYYARLGQFISGYAYLGQDMPVGLVTSGCQVRSVML